MRVELPHVQRLHHKRNSSSWPSLAAAARPSQRAARCDENAIFTTLHADWLGGRILSVKSSLYMCVGMSFGNGVIQQVRHMEAGRGERGNVGKVI